METTTHFSSCNLTADKPDIVVSLSVEIGYAQNGVTDIRIDNIKLQGDSEDGAFTKETFSVELGTNAELNGRSLIINCMVHKVNPDTDMTGIKIDITGSKTEFVHSMNATVNPQTNTAVYTYYISFYS